MLFTYQEKVLLIHTQIVDTRLDHLYLALVLFEGLVAKT